MTNPNPAVGLPAASNTRSKDSVASHIGSKVLVSLIILVLIIS
jgi:hypothetical protein